MNGSTLQTRLRDDLSISFDGLTSSLFPLRNATVLVTGGTGFTGAWLAEAVTFLNQESDFKTKLILQSPRTEGFRARHGHLAGREDIHLQDLDVRNLHELPAGVDYVIHAAATPDARQHASDPTRTIETIVGGTTNVLKAATLAPDLRKILNISSGQIYGPQPMETERLPETHFSGLDPARFTSAYTEAKRMAETICAAYATQYRLAITTARPFAFIGPYQLLDRPWAVNNFVRDATLGGKLRIHGDGETVRSYMYPSDLAAWLLTILVKGDEGAAYNVGHPEGITLLDLAKKVVRLATRPVEIETDTLRDPRASRSRFVPDVTKASKQLGLKVHFGVDESLERMMAWAASLPAR